MQCEVYDTYVQKMDGETMHFDIIVPVETSFKDVLVYGQQYLIDSGQPQQPLEPSRCRFCHIEQASPTVQAAIEQKGYYILAMEGCPAPEAP